MTDTEPGVQYALAQLGKPYVLGATGPDTFDCSGLTQQAMKAAGISISRTTYTQINDGEPVIGDPQRGDLVFPDAGHVVIALGGDQCVHAPQSGDVVKISKYWTPPIAIRRMGTNTGTPGTTSTSGAFGTTSAFNAGNMSLTSDNPITMVKNVIQAFGTFASALSDKGTWFRICKGILGIAILLAGVVGLGFAAFGSPGELVSHAKSQVTSIRKAIPA